MNETAPKTFGQNMETDKDKQEKETKQPLTFGEHEASQEIANKLIPKFHPYLGEAKIRYLCRNNAKKSAGEKVPGQVKKASPIERHLSLASGDGEADFIMIVALDVWNDLVAEKRVALVDHLLSRCVAQEDEKTGETKFSLRPPQVQEFPEVAQRHGKWTPELEQLGNALARK